jgi:phage-related protein
MPKVAACPFGHTIPRVPTADKPLLWLHGAIKTPPFGSAARVEAGVALRRLQRGEVLSMPLSRPMPSIGTRCHELRIRDRDANWRILYRIDTDAIVIVAVFAKTTRATPPHVLQTAKARLRQYDDTIRP